MNRNPWNLNFLFKNQEETDFKTEAFIKLNAEMNEKRNTDLDEDNSKQQQDTQPLNDKQISLNEDYNDSFIEIIRNSVEKIDKLIDKDPLLSLFNCFNCN